MKKLLLLLVFIFPLFANGQNKGIEGIGIVAGPGLSYIFGGDNLSSKFGYIAGIEKVVYRVNEKSMFTAGINYTFQGAKYIENTDAELSAIRHLKSVTADTNKPSGTVDLGYLNIPVLYRYQNETGLFMEAGIQTGFLLDAKDIPDGGESIDAKDKIKLVDIRLPLGVGYILVLVFVAILDWQVLAQTALYCTQVLILIKTLCCLACCELTCTDTISLVFHIKKADL